MDSPGKIFPWWESSLVTQKALPARSRSLQVFAGSRNSFPAGRGCLVPWRVLARAPLAGVQTRQSPPSVCIPLFLQPSHSMCNLLGEKI